MATWTEQPLQTGDRVRVVHPPLSAQHARHKLGRVYYVNRHTGYIAVELDDGLAVCDLEHAFRRVHKE